MGRFDVGDRVRISDRTERRHHRVPAYVKGHEGRVQRVCLDYEEPERLAYGESGPVRTLYRVRLNQADLWKGYEGSPSDTLEIEIFEHWLEPA